jgi:hydrogenase/urease accessory protein HupE
VANSPSVWRPLLVLPVMLFSLARICLAHTTGLSTSELRLATNGVEAELIFAGVDFTLALARLETTSPSDVNHDGRLSAEELAAGLNRVRKFAAECLIVEFDGQPVQPASPGLELDDKDNVHFRLTYPGKRPARLRVRAALFGLLPSDHMHFLSVHEVDGKTLGNKMLSPSSDTLEVICPEGSAKAEPRANTFTDFLKLGVEHIWTGYDHILFLVALLLVCSDFKTAVKIITAFTVAHSITLAVATFNLVSVSSRIVEPMIAASIVYVAVENFIRPEDPKGRWRITFLFGLIHGFGFATVLRDLGVASSTRSAAVPLVAFNLGVETGQIVIAAVLLPVIWRLRKWEPFLRRGVPICSAVVAAAGGYWLIQRLFFN